jgi:hypothetical protein
LNTDLLKSKTQNLYRMKRLDAGLN